MSVRPEDFWSETPPERVIGSECEYNMQDVLPGSFVSATALHGLGYSNHAGYMGSAGGRGRVYSDMSHLEYATAEVMGPAAAAVHDLGGIECVADIVTRSDRPHRGVYRTAGTYIPKSDQLADDHNERPNNGTTSGYHLNLMFPRAVEFDPLFDPLVATSLAARPAIAGGGALWKGGFVLSQKVWGVGGAPIAHSVERRTGHGNKPMAMVPPRLNDADTIGGDEQWARLEVRMADPGLSLPIRFLDFAVTSLTLRLIEQQQASKRRAPDDVLSRERLWGLSLAQPVSSAQRFAGDMSMQRIAQTHDERLMTVLDVNEGLLDAFEQLDQELALPASERLAVRALRMTIDHLRRSQPAQTEYDDWVLATVDYARRYTFVSQGRPPAEVNPSNANMLYRDLHWGQVVADPNTPEKMRCLGKRYWGVKNERHELTPEIRRLAAVAGVSPRALVRASVIDAGNGSTVRNWASYEDPLGQKRSLGDPYGDEELLAA